MKNTTEVPTVFNFHKEDENIIIKGKFVFETNEYGLKNLPEMINIIPKMIDFYYKGVEYIPFHQIEIVVSGRMSYKSTKAADKCHNTPGSMIIVPNLFMSRNYPATLRNRVVSINQVEKYRGCTKLIIDEPELMKASRLHDIREENIIMIIGTPKVRKIGEKSWFIKMSQKYGCKTVKSKYYDFKYKDDMERVEKHLSKAGFITEVMGGFVFLPGE